MTILRSLPSPSDPRVPSRIWQSQYIGRLKAWQTLTVLLALSAITACGNTGDEGLGLEADVTERAPILTTTRWSNVLRSGAYTGRIAILFADGTGARSDNHRFSSRTGISMAPIQKILDQASNVKIARGLPGITDAEIAKARTMAAQRGKHVTDWSLLYFLSVPDPAQAERVMDQLHRNALVVLVEPVVRSAVAGPVTPSLGAQQAYLQAGNGGLNVAAGWNAGLTGAGISVVDIEFFWNVNHEDLQLDPNNLFPPTLPAEGTLPDYAPGDLTTQHGTAVVGVIAGKKNGIGIDGIAPSANVYLQQTTDAAYTPYGSAPGLLTYLIEYYAGEPSTVAIHPGTIFLEEFVKSHPDKPGSCAAPSTPNALAPNCVPIEAYGFEYTVIKEAVENGIVVIEVAGNSGADIGLLPAGEISTGGLLSPNLNITGDDPTSSGAIMVGASNGPAMEKLPASNCGTRVDVYAWGQQVVTAGYGDLGYGTNPEQWYTATFGGTSAAGAQIAGMAALLQEYVRKLYPSEIQAGKDVYLNGRQLRQVLVASGAGQAAKNTGGCEIGVQPDLGKAMQLLNDKTIVPTIEFPLYLQPKQPLLAKPMDLDGDGRGDLISFSKDRKWYVDLSSQGPGGDNYGAWDLTFAADATIPPDAMLFPVVGDYNTDGKADLALYDAKYGQWYIRYTDSQILANNWGAGWSKIIDYSTTAGWEPYSRPVPGDYNGADKNDLTFDRWLDPAIATPNGYLLIDATTQPEGQSAGTDTGAFDQNIPYLSTAQLQAAPGWAYLPLTAYNANTQTWFMDYAVQPTVADVGYDTILPAAYSLGPTQWTDPSAYLAVGPYGMELKQADGKWEVIFGPADTDALDFGGTNCRPVSGDYDGDGVQDRAVLCPTEWRIAYSDHIFADGADGLRHVAMSAKPMNPLPGNISPGGTAYTDMKAIHEYYLKQTGCQGSACTIFDLTKTYPPPVGPYFAECLKYWATQPLQCLNH